MTDLIFTNDFRLEEQSQDYLQIKDYITISFDNKHSYYLDQKTMDKVILDFYDKFQD